MSGEKQPCVFISYAFSNEKNPETNLVDKEFLQEYIGRVASVLQEKGGTVWHSLLPHEDSIISALPYDDAIQYCVDKLTSLQGEYELTLLSILKYPGRFTKQDIVQAIPSTGMKREFAHAQTLGVKRIVVAQEGLEENDLFDEYFNGSNQTVSFLHLDNLFENLGMKRLGHE